MAKDLDLLRLLEPVVRPGNLPSPSRAGAAPVEEQSFATLLEGARERGTSSSLANTPSSTTSADAASPAKPAENCHSLAMLTGPDRIENAGLRALLAQQRESPDPVTQKQNDMTI